MLTKDKKRFRKLHENIFNFIINCLTDSSIRHKFINQIQLIELITNKIDTIHNNNNNKDNRWISSIEAILGILHNLSFGDTLVI